MTRGKPKSTARELMSSRPARPARPARRGRFSAAAFLAERRRQAAERRRKRMLKTMVLALPLLVLGAVLSTYFGSRSSSIPPELVGTWSSDDTRYADRALELAPLSVVFHTGAGNAARYRVLSVSFRHTGNGRTRYLITYDTGGEHSSIGVNLDPGGAAMSLDNPRDAIWRRAGSQELAVSSTMVSRADQSSP